MSEHVTTGLEGLDPRTRTRWESEIRATLLGKNKPGKAGPKACSVCGKPDTRNHKGLTGAHAEASMEAYPQKYRMLTRALESKTDFVIKQQFNAQIAFLTERLLLARMEHEAYEPTTNTANAISNKSLVTGVLLATFKMLGIEIPACPKAKDGVTDRPWSVLQLTEILNLELAKLHGVDSDVTVSAHPAEEEPEAESTGDKQGDTGGEQVAGQQGDSSTGGELRNGEVRDDAPATTTEPPSAAEQAAASLTRQGGTITM